MKIEPRARAIYRDATILLRPKTGLKDMVAELTPGTPEAGGCRRAARSRSRRRCRTSTPTRSSPRSTPTRATTCAAAQRRRRGPARQRPRARADVPALRADRALHPPDQRRSRSAGRTSRARSTTSRCSRRSSATATTQLAHFVESSNAVFAPLAEPGAPTCSATLRELPSSLDETQTGAGQADRAGRRARPDARGPAPGRPRARAGAAQMRPFLRETTPIIRDELRPFARAALPP